MELENKHLNDEQLEGATGGNVLSYYLYVRGYESQWHGDCPLCGAIQTIIGGDGKGNCMCSSCHGKWK